MSTEILYRYENIRYAPSWDEYETSIGDGRVDVILREYRVIRNTPKGAWIDLGYEKKFVRLSAKKRFACPTKADALTSFIARKKRQIGLLSTQIDNAKDALRLAMDMVL